MTERETFFADVILPAAVPNTFTYRVPFELAEYMRKGLRVVVPFGRSKVLTGIVANVHAKVPEYRTKYIYEVLDEQPMVTEIQLDFFKWVAEYYMCHAGEVLTVALPSGLKISSESRVQAHPDFDLEATTFELKEKESMLMEMLKENDHMSFSEVAERLSVKSIYHIIKGLLEKEAIIVFESLKEKYKPMLEKRVRLSADYLSEESLEVLMAKLEKKPKQLNVLLRYLQKIPVFQDKTVNEQGIKKKDLEAAGVSVSSLKTLEKQGVFELFDQEVSRLAEGSSDSDTEFELSEEQAKAKGEILTAFESKDVVLFKGVTGSGKTEIYMELIQHVLDGGGQVLYLLPEIALTGQIVNRLKRFFGDRLGVYHSKFSDNERVEVWKGVLSGRFQIVVGVRSSVFLPFDSLGLIVVDECHENSFKQYDPAPRYNAVDAAMVLAKKHHAKILLGSATPSVEQYYLAKKGIYGLVKLDKRFGDAQMPSIVFANTRLERKKKTLKGEFTSVLLEKINETVGRKEQVILFQNRRGYSPYMSCDECAHIPECPQCSVSLTYHMYRDELLCHYCGHRQGVPKTCPACGSNEMRTVGFGTEKLEEEANLFLPEARVRRMDLDTTKGKHSYQIIIREFSEGEIDILLGTQMVSKGFDFGNVSLVGVFGVDRMLNFPDFRAHERAYQLITQVSGRAGRRADREGMVVIQTANPDQETLRQVVYGDFEDLYASEIKEREMFRYPPFFRLIRVVFKSEDPKVCERAASFYSQLLKEKLRPSRVSNAHEPVISKIRNQYLREVLVRIERTGVKLGKVKAFMREQAEVIKAERKQFKGIRINFDPDPN
ncbi:primosomal protein N' [Fulvitalea axinellae]|uniref:Replication restart protein PriA n=1 Tax=Fulvitalea axinellae TaxID=1182444 RepID=A0AAU9CD01_9BACT|nr:primosomal protein N' [Fulvitalea axinellae]